jgi:hypothetical protein
VIKKYTEIFKQSLQGVDTSDIPNKYLDAKKNYHRILRPIAKAKKRSFKKGLDFGCGSIGSPIVARLFEMEVVGIDILQGIDDSPEGERNRNGIKESKVAVKDSVHLGPQRNLQKMGYSIVLRDTNIYPWEEFSDNEFDFVMAFFALSKEWTNHSDTLDFSGKEYTKRINELFRISKNNSVWYVHPQGHIKSIEKMLKTTEKNIKIENWN